MTRLSFIVIAFFLVLAACTAKLQQHSNNNTSNNSTTVDKGLQGGAGKRDSVRLEDIVLKTTNYPTAVRYHLDTTKEETLSLTPQNIFTTYKYLWNMEVFDSIVWVSSIKSSNYLPYPKKIYHTEHTYRLYYKGIIVGEHSRQLVHVSMSGKVFEVVNLINVNTINKIDPNPTIDIDQATDIAVKSFSPKTKFKAAYLQEPRAKFAKILTSEKLKQINPVENRPMLYIRYIGNQYRLVYVFNIEVVGQWESWEFIIDAHEGKILAKENTNFRLCESCGSGNYVVPSIVACSFTNKS